MSETMEDGWERPVDIEEIRLHDQATAPSRKIEAGVDELVRDAACLREKLVDGGHDVEREYAENIVQYLNHVELSKAIIVCREAIEWSYYHVDDFKKIAGRIVVVMNCCGDEHAAWV